MKKIIIALALIASMTLLAACGGEEAPVTPVDIAAPVATEAPTPTPVTAELISTPEPMPPEPAELTAALVELSGHYADLDCDQLILVDADGDTAAVTLYELTDSGSWAAAGETMAAHVGRNGVEYNKMEGDGKTPGGIFHIGFAFGNADKPDTALEYHDVTDDSYWVDDPDSVHYNTWVEGTADKDWDSAERLSRIEEYKYALVIEYNYADACVAGKGSAIFVHVGNEPTSGCIALNEADMLSLLKWLDPDAFPQILIID